jgi:hypothetical protein
MRRLQQEHRLLASGTGKQSAMSSGIHIRQIMQKLECSTPELADETSM